MEKTDTRSERVADLLHTVVEHYQRACGYYACMLWAEAQEEVSRAEFDAECIWAITDDGGL